MKKFFTLFFAALMSAGMWADPNIVTPTISGDLSFTESTTVTMECTSPNSDIYYTTDGVTDPRCDCAAAPEYTHPITITETTIIKAAAYDGNDWSAVAEVTFTKVPASNPAATVVTITDSDFPASGSSFTKDGVTVSAYAIDGMQGNISGPGSFSTTLGNFTKIEVSAASISVSGEGWSGDSEHKTWTGNASSVSFIGDINGYEEGTTLKFTIEPAPEPEPEQAIVYDVAQVIAAADASSIAIDSTIIVRGVISKIEIKGKNFAKYGSACIYVADATGAEGEFEFYNCFSLLADTFRTSVPAYDATSTTWAQLDALTDGNGVTVHVGDTVIAEGKYNKYYNTYQLNQGCYLTDIMPFVVERELTKVGFHFPELNQPADNNIEMVGSFEEGTMDMEKNITTGWFLTYSFIHAAEEETFKFRDKTNTDMVLCKKVGDNWVQAIFTFGDLWAADTWLGDACMLIELDIHDSELYAWMEGMPEPEPEVTAVENVAVAEKVVKIVRNGQVLIIRDGKLYNVQGAEIK